jgi:hypothetical protein
MSEQNRLILIYNPYGIQSMIYNHGNTWIWRCVLTAIISCFSRFISCLSLPLTYKFHTIRSVPLVIAVIAITFCFDVSNTIFCRSLKHVRLLVISFSTIMSNYSWYHSQPSCPITRDIILNQHVQLLVISFSTIMSNYSWYHSQPSCPMTRDIILNHHVQLLVISFSTISFNLRHSLVLCWQ